MHPKEGSENVDAAYILFLCLWKLLLGLNIQAEMCQFTKNTKSEAIATRDLKEWVYDSDMESKNGRFSISIFDS